MSKPTLTYDDLLEYFYGSSVPPEQNRLGVEYELFCFNKDTQKRLGYFDSPGIREIINLIKEYAGGEGVYEGDNIIGLKSDDFEISIEPGGQLEISIAPKKNVSEIELVLNKYLSVLKEIKKTLPILFVHNAVDSLSRIEEVHWVPKKRYEIMKEYFTGRGSHSHYMMKMTAAFHIAIDYNSPEDAMSKFHKGLELNKIIVKKIKNSKECKDELDRIMIWENTDPERCGIPRFKGRVIETFEDYVNYALDIRMLFQSVNGNYERVQENLTFRDFLLNGIDGRFPSISDWKLHLNSIFPVMRFNRNILELRMFNSGAPKCLLGLAAMIKAIFYKHNSSISNLSFDEVIDESCSILMNTDEAKYLDEFRCLSDCSGLGSVKPLEALSL